MATSRHLTKPFRLTRAEIDRIFAKIDIDYADPFGHCWVWTGARDRHGYGYVRFNGDVANIHRLIYAWLIAPLPNEGRRRGVVVLHHSCGNPSCCNPIHLQPMLHGEHMLISEGTIGYVQSRKTHCPRGHRLPPKVEGKPRRCAICDRTRHRAYYLANRETVIARSREWKRRHRKTG